MDDTQYITEEELDHFLYEGLIKLGYVPEQGELHAISDVVFDFLVNKGVIIMGEE